MNQQMLASLVINEAVISSRETYVFKKLSVLLYKSHPLALAKIGLLASLSLEENYINVTLAYAPFPSPCQMVLILLNPDTILLIYHLTKNLTFQNGNQE